MSLRLRLSLGITGVLVMFFALVGVVEYKILQRSFMIQVEAELRDRRDLLTREIKDLARASGELTRQNVKRIHVNLKPFGAEPSDVFVQISRPDGTILRVSDNLDGLHLRIPPASEDASNFQTVKVGSTEVRLLTTPIEVASTPVATLVLGASLDLADASALRATRWLIALRAIELALTLLIALFLLSRGLRPLRTVAATAERIVESGDVSQRVEGSEGLDEVGRIENSFNAVVAKVESLLQAQKRLLADTSHELRNPLTVVRNNVDFLRKPLDSATRLEVAEETEMEVKRMIALVEDLMLLSKAEGTRQMHVEPVSLDRLANEAVERMKASSGGRTVELVEAATPVVLGDEDRLRQIFTNLISNAIRYTNAGGRIVVRVERRKDMGVIVVADDGIGVAPEHLPHIFERFYRVDSARSRATGGSGLGLSIVKALVDAHRGHIQVESKLGQGTTFTVSIPLEDAEKPRITNLMPVSK